MVTWEITLEGTEAAFEAMKKGPGLQSVIRLLSGYQCFTLPGDELVETPLMRASAALFFFPYPDHRGIFRTKSNHVSGLPVLLLDTVLTLTYAVANLPPLPVSRLQTTAWPRPVTWVHPRALGDTVSNIDRLLEGALDIHVHFAPDPKVARRGNAIDIALQAREMGMQGLVLKSHEYPTHPVAYTTSQAVPGITLIGGVALDVEVGGLNPMAVESTAMMGGRVVWMPTYSARADRQHKGLNGGIYILDGRGRLVPEVYAILDLVKAHDMVLATGHLSTEESIALVAEARNLGIQRVVVTHATTMAFCTGMTLEDMKSLAAMGAYIEHCLHVMMPLTNRLAPKELVETISAIGSENCIISTDFGQDFHPMPPEGMRMGIATMLQAGMEEVEVGMLVKDNPSRLLGL